MFPTNDVAVIVPLALMFADAVMFVAVADVNITVPALRSKVEPAPVNV